MTRDERGYETTLLLHVRWPGDRPQVLYWYRTAPGMRVGRPALDEDAIRIIEDQHPEIEFDWAHLIEASTMLPPEVERRPERPRRKPRPSDGETAREPTVEAERGRVAAEPPEPERPDAESEPAAPPDHVPAPHRAANVLLDQLVGREIAARLRARFAELAAHLSRITDVNRRADCQARAAALDPDSWLTPEAILAGVQHADRRFEDLRRDMDG